MIMILTTFFSLETTRKMVKNVVFNAFGRLYCSVLTGLYLSFALYVNSTKRQTHQSSVYVAIKCKISLPGLCTKQANGICCYFFSLVFFSFFHAFFHMNLIFFSINSRSIFIIICPLIMVLFYVLFVRVALLWSSLFFLCLHMKSIFFKAHANDNWINRIHSTLLLALKV